MVDRRPQSEAAGCGQLQIVGGGRLTSARLDDDGGGTVTRRRAIALATNANAENRGTWAFSGNNANLIEQDPDDLPDGAVFTNPGVLRNLAGTNTIDIGFVSTAAGRIEVEAGILRVPAGRAVRAATHGRAGDRDAHGREPTRDADESGRARLAGHPPTACPLSS